MSSDYTSRLRAELLRAGAAAEHAPGRHKRTLRRLRPLAVAVAVALLVATVVLTVPAERGDERSAQDLQNVFELSYRVPPGDAAQTAQILRERLRAAGIAATVTAGEGTLTIKAQDTTRADVTTLTAPGRLAIYDWERSVLGPDGRPAPTDPAVTGNPGAGQDASLRQAEARTRAAKNPDGHAVQAERWWFALGGEPALTNADVATARADKDPAGGEIVSLELTPPGERAFTTLTRELAQRGARFSLGGDPLQTSQHLAFVLDDRLISVPFINWQQAPDGIDGAEGTYMSGLATPELARLTAALLSAGPLPTTLQPIAG